MLTQKMELLKRKFGNIPLNLLEGFNYLTAFLHRPARPFETCPFGTALPT